MPNSLKKQLTWTPPRIDPLLMPKITITPTGKWCGLVAETWGDPMLNRFLQWLVDYDITVYKAVEYLKLRDDTPLERIAPEDYASVATSFKTFGCVVSEEDAVKARLYWDDIVRVQTVEELRKRVRFLIDREGVRFTRDGNEIDPLSSI